MEPPRTRAALVPAPKGIRRSRWSHFACISKLRARDDIARRSTLTCIHASLHRDLTHRLPDAALRQAVIPSRRASMYTSKPLDAQSAPDYRRDDRGITQPDPALAERDLQAARLRQFLRWLLV